MYHLAIFRHEDSAERIAGKMELRQIRTGLRGDHTLSGNMVYNLFVSDRQAEEAMRLLPDLCEDEDKDVMECPKCGSTDVHPVEAEEEDSEFSFEPRFHILQDTGEPLELCCKGCGHTWQ